MKKPRDNDLSDRRKTATDAKMALLQSFRAAQEAAAPSQPEKQAERQAIAAAREERRAERERIKLQERERAQAEAAEQAAAAETAARAEAEERETADRNRIARVIADEAARKAERDRRYANRKARNA